MPDIYLRELKYSHCLSSFFLPFFLSEKMVKKESKIKKIKDFEGVVRRALHALLCFEEEGRMRLKTFKLVKKITKYSYWSFYGID